MHHELVDGETVFSHPLSKQFFIGLRKLYPDSRLPSPVWGLPLVLRRLTRRPFEPMANCEPCLLAWKTAFLIAITSARRVSELVALRHASPYFLFLPHAVRLQPDIRFLPKVVSDFPVSADILLPDFYPQPVSSEERLFHTLDVQSALLFFLDRTKFPNWAPILFVSYAPSTLGQLISLQ